MLLSYAIFGFLIFFWPIRINFLCRHLQKFSSVQFNSVHRVVSMVSIPLNAYTCRLYGKNNIWGFVVCFVIALIILFVQVCKHGFDDIISGTEDNDWRNGAYGLMLIGVFISAMGLMCLCFSLCCCGQEEMLRHDEEVIRRKAHLAEQQRCLNDPSLLQTHGPIYV